MTPEQLNRLIDLVHKHHRTINFENEIFMHKFAELLRKPDTKGVSVDAKPVE